QSASGEILTGGGVLNVSNGGGTTLNGSVQTAGGDISAAITNNMIIGGSVQTAGGNVTSTIADSLTIGGSVLTQGGDFDTTIGNDFTLSTGGIVQTAGGNITSTIADSLTIGGSVLTQGGNLTMDVVGAFGQSATGEILTGGGNLNVTNGGGTTLSGTVTTAGGDVTVTIDNELTLSTTARVVTQGGDVTVNANDGFDQTVNIRDQALLDVGAGRVLIEASGQVLLTGLRTAASGDDAVTIRAFDIQQGGDARPDILQSGTGRLNLFASRYINLNNITNTNNSNLRLTVGGKSGLAEVRTGAVMLGLMSDAGIVFDRLYADHAGIFAPDSTYFKITSGITQEDIYITSAQMNARLGRLKERTLEPASWITDTQESTFFDSAALSFGGRQENYTVTGSGDYLTNPNSVLVYNFLYDDPNISSNGLAVTWSPRYVLARAEAERQRIDQRMSMTLDNFVAGADYVDNLTQTNAFINRVDARLNVNETDEILSDVLSAPLPPAILQNQLDGQNNFNFDNITIDPFEWLTPVQNESNGFVNLSALSESQEPVDRAEP
ncbi:MAG: hypothetical protein ACON41_05255, partial [Parvibaculales bacterium]